ncbi:MAG: hypothetical protein JO212_15650 [Acetobacteraceae bacterium]|nr:hypothetical protein [Acetobacteraceae bacterium]
MWEGVPFSFLDSSLENRRQEEWNKLQASGGKQSDDLLNGFAGAVVSGFEFAGRLVSGVGAVMEAAVGEWTAEPFVEEQEEQFFGVSRRRSGNRHAVAVRGP